MNNEMTVIIKDSAEKGLKLSKKNIPGVGDNEVLIKILATSICGTDMHIYEWDEWSRNRVKPPLTVGHELAGEIVEVGVNVTNVRIGDIVSVETHIVCEECELCRTGNAHVCEKTLIIGVDCDGAFACYFAAIMVVYFP